MTPGTWGKTPKVRFLAQLQPVTHGDLGEVSRAEKNCRDVEPTLWSVAVSDEALDVPVGRTGITPSFTLPWGVLTGVCGFSITTPKEVLKDWMIDKGVHHAERWTGEGL